MVKRIEMGVAEINQDTKMVRRVLGSEGLSFRNGGDTLEVTRASLPVIRLCVTNHRTSVSAELVTETSGDQESDGNGLRRTLIFDTDPRSVLILRKESGARMVLDEAVRYLLTPLLKPAKRLGPPNKMSD